MLVVATWFPGPRTPESGIFNLRDVELLALDHEVTVVHLCPPSVVAEATVERLGDITIHRTPMSVTSPAAIQRARRLIRDLVREHDLLHSMAISSLLPLGRGTVTIPWVHTEHWSGFLAPETAPVAIRTMAALLARRLRLPDVVVTVSEALAAVVRRHRDGPIAVIPNHVMTPAAGAPLGRGHDDPQRLVAVGGLIPRKGPLLAVQTVARLRARGRPVVLRWIGDGPLRAEVTDAAERLGVGGDVEFAGRLSPDDVSRSLLSAELFLLPTEGETFGVSIAEALTHGLPVVVGARGGQEEFVGPGEGVLVARQDPDAYADAVIRTLDGRTPGRGAEIARTAAIRFSPESRRVAYRRAYDLAAGTGGLAA